MFQCVSLCFLVLQSLFETQACKLAKPLYRSWVNLLRLSWKQSSSCGSRKCVTSATSLENLCSLCLQDCIFNVLERTGVRTSKKMCGVWGFVHSCLSACQGAAKSAYLSNHSQKKNSWPLRQRAQSRACPWKGKFHTKSQFMKRKCKSFKESFGGNLHAFEGGGDDLLMSSCLVANYGHSSDSLAVAMCKRRAYSVKWQLGLAMRIVITLLKTAVFLASFSRLSWPVRAVLLKRNKIRQAPKFLHCLQLASLR